MRHHRKPMSGLGSQQPCWKKRQKLRDRASCHVDGREWQHLILSENMISQFNFAKSPLALETNTQCKREHTRFFGGGNCSCQWAEKWADVQAVTATATSVVLGVKWFEEHFTVCQGIQITTKVLLIPVAPPRRENFLWTENEIFFHQRQPSEGHWPSVLSAKTDMKHLWLLKAISTSKDRWEEFLKKWKKACVQNEQFFGFLHV